MNGGDGAMASKKKGRQRYLGYVILGSSLYIAWFKIGFNPGLVAALSVLTVLFGLFLAPVPCGAHNRDGTLCRENAKGILRGCWRQQHKWQNAKMLIERQSWARFGNNVFRSIGGNAAALTVITGFLSIGATLVVPFLSKGA